MAGKIFQDITGCKVADFSTTSEIWDAVAASRPTVANFGSREYGQEVVTVRGSVFKLKEYDLNIDYHLTEL